MTNNFWKEINILLKFSHRGGLKFIHTNVYKKSKIYISQIRCFFMLLSKKAIIAINKEFENGVVINDSSLDYAITLAKKSNNWLKSLAMLVRAILIDHVFEEGNKRTAAAVIMAVLEMHEIAYNKDKINKMIVKMLRKNITNLNEIMFLIKNVTE